MGKLKFSLIIGVILLLIAGFALGPKLFLAATNYSAGYRAGKLTKFDTDGYFLKTGEGQLLLGNLSSPLAQAYQTSDGYQVAKDFNPWHFSTDSGLISRSTGLVGREVWVKYVEHNYNLSFRKTKYQALELDQASGSTVPKPFMEVEKPFGLPKTEGARGGRIVKASSRGKLVDTFEIVLQMGDAGNQFKALSISDAPLFDYAVSCLKSGKTVVVKYVDQGVMQFNFNDTPYYVYRIETAQ